jgi:hypothetical protein
VNHSDLHTIVREEACSTPLSLVVRTAGARVQVNGSGRATARVTARFDAGGLSSGDAAVFAETIARAIVFEASTVTVRTPEITGVRRGLVRQLEYEIEVPQQTRASLSATNGPIGVTGIAGPLQLEVANGPVSIEDIAGAVDLNLTNGPARLDRIASGVSGAVVNGPARLRDISGDVRFDVANGLLRAEDLRGAVTATVENGPITFESAIGGDVTLRSRHGPILVRLPANSRFGLDAEAEHGEVRCDFAVSEGRDRPAGVYRLLLRSHRGDIRLHELEPARA